MLASEATYRFSFYPPPPSKVSVVHQYVRARDEKEALRRATDLARTNWPPQTRIILEEVRVI